MAINQSENFYFLLRQKYTKYGKTVGVILTNVENNEEITNS